MIYLMRHGLDDENYIGGYSNVSLTSTGKKQVEKSAKWLTENVEGIIKIYSSDVKRAIETTDIINKYLNLDIEYTKKLRELDKGKLNGMLKSEAKIFYPKFIDVKDVNITYPYGESMLDLYKRIKIFLTNINKYDNSLLVTHRGVINMIYTLLNNDELTMNKKRYNVTHASIHELNLEKNKIRRIK